jgi:hypothetical protein
MRIPGGSFFAGRPGMGGRIQGPQFVRRQRFTPSDRMGG